MKTVDNSYEEGTLLYNKGASNGNAADVAWDLDMREEIPIEMVDETKFIRWFQYRRS